MAISYWEIGTTPTSDQIRQVDW